MMPGLNFARIGTILVNWLARNSNIYDVEN